jgi:hypothetical protein
MSGAVIIRTLPACAETLDRGLSTDNAAEFSAQIYYRANFADYVALQCKFRTEAYTFLA